MELLSARVQFIPDWGFPGRWICEKGSRERGEKSAFFRKPVGNRHSYLDSGLLIKCNRRLP